MSEQKVASPVIIVMVPGWSCAEHTVWGVFVGEKETHRVENLTEMIAVHHGNNQDDYSYSHQSKSSLHVHSEPCTMQCFA